MNHKVMTKLQGRCLGTLNMPRGRPEGGLPHDLNGINWAFISPFHAR